MWIRNQNKCVMIKCKNIATYKNIKMDKFVVITNDGTDIELGYYSTKEKALKVLDMIEKEIRLDTCNTRVFQMLQDNEVE